MEHQITQISERALLDTAAQLIASRGYNKVTLQMLADQFGVTRPAIYYYFPSKQKLLEKIYSDAVDSLIDEWEAVLAIPGDPLTKLNSALVVFIERVLQKPINVRVIHSLEYELDPNFNLKQRERWHSYFKKLRELYTEAVALDQVSDLDARIAIYTIIGGIMNLSRWWDRDGELNAERVLSQTLDLLMNGYKRT